jgi:hypothetical protein
MLIIVGPANTSFTPRVKPSPRPERVSGFLFCVRVFKEEQGQASDADFP